MAKAKYNAAQLKALGAKGEAFKNPDGSFSYPIADADDLGKAISAVGRGNADHDAIRKYIIGRAKALGLSKEIPDNWNADGSLSDAKAATADGVETRGSYQLTKQQLQCAIGAALPPCLDGSVPWVWVADFDEDTVVYEVDCDGYMQVGYSIDEAGCVQLDGQATPVIPVTTYLPVDGGARADGGAGHEHMHKHAGGLVHSHAHTHGHGNYDHTEADFEVTHTHGHDDSRAAATPEDAGITAKIVAAKMATFAALEAQAADPDAGIDPDDVRVQSHLEDALDSLKEALVDQAIDQAGIEPDGAAPAGRMRIPVVVKRGDVFTDLTEHEQPIVGRLQVRDGADGGAPVFTGYASTTGQAYRVSDWLGEYDETMAPGSFAKALRDGGYVPLLIDHEGFPLAAWRNGSDADTLSLSEDGQGLLSSAPLDVVGNPHAQALHSALRRGDLDKMSFAFRAVKQTWSADYSDRQVTEAQLFDVSVVKTPANPGTSAGLRSAMAEVIGREGRSVLHELRSGAEGPEQLEAVLRVLREADEQILRRAELRYAGRGRLLVVGSLIGEQRAGKVLSKANKALVNKAAAALSEAQDHIAKLASSADPDEGDGSQPDEDGSEARKAGRKLYEARFRALDL